MKKYAKVKRYDLGGNMPWSNPYSGYGQFGSMLGNALNTSTISNSGMQNPWLAGISGGITGASTGAALGPWGAAGGFLIGALGSGIGASNRNKQISKQEDLEKQQLDEFKLQMDKQREDMLKQQRLNYSQAYINANPTYGIPGQGIYGYGGKINMARPLQMGTGGPIPKPTAKDSLDLYNNTLLLQRYYGNKEYKKISKRKADSNWETNLNEAMDDVVLNPNIPNTDHGVGLRSTKEYRRDIDDNRFKQRDIDHYILDTRSPMPLYDRRIPPHYMESRSNLEYPYEGGESNPKNIQYQSELEKYKKGLPNDFKPVNAEDRYLPGRNKMFGDFVRIYSYDPLAIKPWQQLTPKERQMRVKKFGKDGVPDNAPELALLNNKKKVINPIEVTKNVKPLDTTNSTVNSSTTYRGATINNNVPQPLNSTISPMMVTDTQVQATPRNIPAPPKPPVVQKNVSEAGYTIYNNDGTVVTKKGKPALPSHLKAPGTPQKLIDDYYKSIGYTPQMGYGGTIPFKAVGGELNSLSSSTQKVQGDTHSQDTNKDGMTGVTLRANGNNIAEVEDQEVIYNDKVFSDRLKFKKGTTFAREAEKLGKKQGKYEEMANSNDMFAKSTGKRMYARITQGLDNLYQIQESLKGSQPVSKRMAQGGPIPYSPDYDPNWYSPMNPNGLSYMDVQDTELVNTNNGLSYMTNLYDPPLQAVPRNTPSENREFNNNNFGNYLNAFNNSASSFAPYIDNLVNASLTKRTPNIPVPSASVSYNLTASPLKTNYNINPALNSANDSFRSLNKNIDDNVSNSNVARANKLGAFANLLKNKSDLYNTKENIQTDLTNKNNMNLQSVNNYNLQNQQNINNQNIDKMNSYRMNNTIRQDDIRRQLSSNIANLSNDFTKQVQDRNLYSNDLNRVLIDSLQYNNSAGLAQLVDSSQMDALIANDPNAYQLIERQLKNAGQNAALNRFYQKYKKR